jgi:signal transduction histidine kinase
VTSDEQIEALRASRRRLLAAADGERRLIERRLHDGVHQQLVALAVNLQLASTLTDSDPGAARTLLDEMARDVHQALAETTQLAQRLYPPLDVVGLAALLRSAAAAAGVRATVDVDLDTGKTYPRELMETVYLCWLETLEHAAETGRAAVKLRTDADVLTFEIVIEGDAALEPSRDRVEALGGRLSSRSDSDGHTQISGSVPLG